MLQSQCITKLQLGNFFLRMEKIFLSFYIPNPTPAIHPNLQPPQKKF